MEEMIKRYYVDCGYNCDYVSDWQKANYTDEQIAKDYLVRGEYMTETTMIETHSRKEAEKVFNAVCSDYNITKTNVGYELSAYIVELCEEEGFYDEDGDWNSFSIRVLANKIDDIIISFI